MVKHGETFYGRHTANLKSSYCHRGFINLMFQKGKSVNASD